MTKKKVIIYCVAELEARRAIEYFLEDDYEIIGYTDTYASIDPISRNNECLIPPPRNICEVAI